MPIRINLLAEALEEEDLRQRDPVKRAIYVGSLLAVLTLVWWSSTLLEYMLERSGLGQIQAEIDSRTNEYNVVNINLKKIADVQNRLDALQKLSAARFLQGSFLNALQQVYVPNVQPIRLRLEQTYSLSAGIAPKTNDFGVVAGRPAVCTERKVLFLDARDFSPNPGDQVNKFKAALASQAYFSLNFNPTNGVRLASLSPPQTSSDSKPFVTFSLECRFADKTP